MTEPPADAFDRAQADPRWQEASAILRHPPGENATERKHNRREAVQRQFEIEIEYGCAP